MDINEMAHNYGLDVATLQRMAVLMTWELHDCEAGCPDCHAQWVDDVSWIDNSPCKAMTHTTDCMIHPDNDLWAGYTAFVLVTEDEDRRIIMQSVL